MERDPTPRGRRGGGPPPGGRSRLLAGATLLAALVVPALVRAAAEASEAAGAGAHGHKGEFLVPPNVWAIVSFLLVLGILVWKLLPQIVQVMDRRAETIREALEAAERARGDREALLATHAQEIQRSREEAQALIAAGKAEALKVRESIVQVAEKEAARIAERARREVELAKESAIEDLQRRAVELAFDLSRRLVRKSLNPAEHQELIQESIKSLPRA